MKEVFSLGCSSVAFHSGVVMVEFDSIASLQTKEGGKGPEREPALRMMLTTEGAVETFNALRGILDKLTEVGVLKKDAPGAGDAASDDAGGQATQVAADPESPNFS